MRLKSYTAPSMAEAMHLVRQELGDDAIIVSTQRAVGGKGVRITAALEPEDAEAEIGGALAGHDISAIAEAVRQALVQHGAPERLVERMTGAARQNGLDDLILACAAALETAFGFAPLPETAAPRPFMLIGPPGCGKTLAVAKLAARSVLKRRSVGVITADRMRAGAVEQLAAFTKILEIDLKSARGPDSLRRAVEQAMAGAELVFVDSPGLNPFKTTDMDYLAALVEAADVEPILVLAAGGDAVEAAEIGEAFGAVGATRLLATRLDTTRRLGGILAAAEAAQLIFCDVSSNGHVADGLSPLSPVALARLVLPQGAQQAAPSEQNFWTEAHA